MDAGTLSARIAEAARELEAESGTDPTLATAVGLALRLVPASDDAGITTVLRDRSVETPASTSDRALRVDELQYQHGDGPCLAAVWEDEVVSCPDLESDLRWGEWGPTTARETGVRSMLCFRLYTHESQVGALNLYAEAPHAFSGEDVEVGRALAAHIAVALVSERKAENLLAGMDSRSLIGQAQGILMERYAIDAGRAFAVLTRVSQSTNRKLNEIALELVTTRVVPVAGDEVRPG